MSITSLIKSEIMQLNNQFMQSSLDKYDFWNEHIKFVVQEAVNLAKIYGADLEIVELSALLHDVALMKGGEKADHHIKGKEIANELLTKHNYPQGKKERVLGCVLHHRTSKNATNIEELCVADADILAHFDNLPNAFRLAVKKGLSNKELKEWLEKDYNDLSNKTKETFQQRYNNIINVLFGELKI